MKLTPQQRAYVRKRTYQHEPDPSEIAGELNIVPFLDVVVNLIIFLLATVQAVLAIAEIDAQLPTLGRTTGRANLDDESSSLNLSVTVTGNGVIVSGSGGHLAPGCTSTGRGQVTVPMRNRRYDWEGLTTCARRVKAEYPSERKVILTANPDIEFEHLIGAMDALRADGTDELFPDVMLSAGVR